MGNQFPYSLLRTSAGPLEADQVLSRRRICIVPPPDKKTLKQLKIAYWCLVGTGEHIFHEDYLGIVFPYSLLSNIIYRGSIWGSYSLIPY